MNLLDKFVNQPVSIQLSMFWVLIVTIIMIIVSPWFGVVLILGGGSVLAISNLIIHFVITKGEGS